MSIETMENFLLFLSKDSCLRGGTKKGVELIYPDGTLIKTFKSQGDCAKFLVLDKRIISSFSSLNELFYHFVCILSNRLFVDRRGRGGAKTSFAPPQN